jgi:hypothetical protein
MVFYWAVEEYSQSLECENPKALYPNYKIFLGHIFLSLSGKVDYNT